jgi:hypothetical protein
LPAWVGPAAIAGSSIHFFTVPHSIKPGPGRNVEMNGLFAAYRAIEWTEACLGCSHRKRALRHKRQS